VAKRCQSAKISTEYHVSVNCIGLLSVKLAFHGADMDTDTDILADFRARIFARMSACPATSLFSLRQG